MDNSSLQGAPQGGVLALDLGRFTGWAYGHPDGWRALTPLEWAAGAAPNAVRFGTADLDARPGLPTAPATTTGRRMCSLGAHLLEAIAAARPAVIVFESPLGGSGFRGQEAMRQLVGYAGLAEMTAAAESVRVLEDAVSRIRKHFCGKGNASKTEDVPEACRARGWDPQTTDQSDALALLDYAMATLHADRRAA